MLIIQAGFVTNLCPSESGKWLSICHLLSVTDFLTVVGGDIDRFHCELVAGMLVDMRNDSANVFSDFSNYIWPSTEVKFVLK